jgi:hypothetical protein
MHIVGRLWALMISGGLGRFQREYRLTYVGAAVTLCHRAPKYIQTQNRITARQSDTPGIMFELRLARLTESVGTNLSRAAASPFPLDLGPLMPSICSTPRKVITIARLPERRRQG